MEHTIQNQIQSPIRATQIQIVQFVIYKRKIECSIVCLNNAFVSSSD